MIENKLKLRKKSFTIVEQACHEVQGFRKLYVVHLPQIKRGNKLHPNAVRITAMPYLNPGRALL